MQAYADFCGTARAAEVLAMRWTPLVVRNIMIGARTFREIREGIPDISPTVLTDRLRLLERLGVLHRHISGGRAVYDLTEMGDALREVVQVMSAWGERWIPLAPEHYRASLVLWKLSRLLPAEDLPEAPVVVRFDVADDDQRHYWLVLRARDRTVLTSPTADQEDAVVASTGEFLTKWFVGELSLTAGIRSGLIEFTGPRELEQLVAGWGGLGSWLAPRGPAARLALA
jgi:DNA-binding HxlR family transcriptional regulator